MLRFGTGKSIEELTKILQETFYLDTDSSTKENTHSNDVNSTLSLTEQKVETLDSYSLLESSFPFIGNDSDINKEIFYSTLLKLVKYIYDYSLIDPIG